MQDIMMYLYNTFLDDQLISKHVKADSIKFYSYPNANDIQNTVIVIDELISPKMSDFADDDPLTYEYIFQVDIFVKQNKSNVNGSLLSRELILRVARIMWDLGFGEFQSFNPTYEENFNLYRQSKQFRGRKYIKEMEQ